MNIYDNIEAECEEFIFVIDNNYMEEVAVVDMELHDMLEEVIDMIINISDHCFRHRKGME